MTARFLPGPVTASFAGTVPLWQQDGTVVNMETKTVSVVKKGKKTAKTTTEASKPVTIDVAGK